MEVLPTTNFQPDIIVAGFRLGEPVIVATGLLVSLVCFYAWYRLGKKGSSEDSFRLSRLFFLLMGLSTLIGAMFGHCFLYLFDSMSKMPGWVLSMIAVSALEQASIVRSRSIIGLKWGRALTWLNIGELTLALWFVTSTRWFPGVEIHSAFGLLCIVTPLEIIALTKRGSRGSRLILLGILCLVAGVLVHIFKISLGVWFSYFDIAHLFMCAAIWQMMRGVEAFSTTSEPA